MSASKTPPGRDKRPGAAAKPFSIRLTDEERWLLLERAGQRPLATYLRDLALKEGSQAPRRRAANPVRDHEALARVLAALGQSRIAGNLNQLAKAANIGALPVTPQTDRRSLLGRPRHAARPDARARHNNGRRTMILNGNQRGGAYDLARHLMKPENEHIELHEIRGFVADTLLGALKEAEAVSRGTKCRQFLYSLSLSPPEAEAVPVAAFEDAIERIEGKLGLTGHPRVVVLHEKEGRRHAHCVWSRIAAESMKAVRLSHDRLKLGDISRQLYLEHGWKMPEGLIDPALRNPLNFDRKEWFQAKRAGKDPRDIKAALQQCWAASASAKAFRQALEQRGYYLANGDRRAVVAVDVHGEVYAAARWLGLKTKEVNARMGNPEALPPVADVQGRVAGIVREKLTGFAGLASEEFAHAAQTLEGRRIAMIERHRASRRNLEAKHDTRWIAEAKARAERFRSGLRGLWDRITGAHARLREQNEREVAAAVDRDAHDKQALIERQLEERRQLQHDIRRARLIHTREMLQLHRQLAEHRRKIDEAAALPEDQAETLLAERLRRGRTFSPS